MRMNICKTHVAAAIVSLGFASAAHANVVTGDPSADAGWAWMGHSLENGVYAAGSANYGFHVYSAGFTIQSGSNLEISDGNLSWLAGDTVVGVGGRFESITAADAGWTAFSGNSVNALLSSTGPRLQVKFGTANAAWATSSTAPGGGDGLSGSSLGGGRVQVRTSSYFSPDTASSGEGYTWDDHSGQLLVLDKEGHIAWDGVSTQPDKRAARMIWIWDEIAQHVVSWELLLNVSLLDRIAPVDFTGLLPSIGDQAILTVQDGNSSYTNALVMIIPEPASLVLLGIGGFTLLRRRRRTA